MSKKKRTAYNMESDDDDDSSESSPDDCNSDLIIDFEGRSPVDSDYHGVIQLLGQLFVKAPIDCIGMANSIIAQSNVGSVICQAPMDNDDNEDDDDDDMCEEGTIFGITTILNITLKKDTKWIEHLRRFILEKAKVATDAIRCHFEDILSNNSKNSVGFLINERFINIPAQISVPLLETLHKEIEASKNKDNKFKLDHLVMIVKFHREKIKKCDTTKDIYVNSEEEILVSSLPYSFEYSVINECDTAFAGNWTKKDTTLTPYRKVLLFESKKLPIVINSIKKFLNNE